MKRTPSKNAAVDVYIDALDESIQPLFVSVRETIIATEPGLDEAIKWRDCLTYSLRKNLIQTVVGKGKVSLIFFDGLEIDDPAGLLEGDGKRVRTMRITSPDFDDRALRSYVRQAARLAG
jgi:hypothetical protein